MSPTVTALVPAYQAAGFIQATLDSLSAQTHESLKVIVSVDLCEDDTYEICKRHAAKDGRFEVIKQTQRLGWVGNSNYLLHVANTEYALFAFHDDILFPAYIEKTSSALDGDPESVISYSDVLVTLVDGTKTVWIYKEINGMSDRLQRATSIFMKEGGPWWVPMRGLFRLKEVGKINGLKRHAAGEFVVGNAWMFHMSLLGGFCRVPEILCQKFYRKDGVSMTWKFTDSNWFEASASCIRELWNAGIPTNEKIRLSRRFFDILETRKD